MIVYLPPDVPKPITEDYAIKLKMDVRKKVKCNIEQFYPEVVLSYASGKRSGDCEGTGPGFVQAYQVVTLLEANGIECYSGLHHVPGMNWESFFLRIDRSKVFIALLDYAYFQSFPCMHELHHAIEAKVQIMLVRMEENFPKRIPPPAQEQWEGQMNDEGDELVRREVRKFVNTKNAIPQAGTLLTAPETFDWILEILRVSLSLSLSLRPKPKTNA
jgi:hypothetical protein